MADLFAKYRCYVQSEQLDSYPCSVYGSGIGGSTPTIQYEDHTFSNGVASDMYVATKTGSVYIGQVSDANFTKMFEKVYWDFFTSADYRGKTPTVYAVLQPNNLSTSPLVQMNPDGSNGATIVVNSDNIRIIPRPNTMDESIKTAWETAGSFDNYYTGCCWLITFGGATPVVKYTVTETLSHMSSDSPAELEENEQFTFNYNVEPGYEIQSLTSNIGTVNIETDKKGATITGTATENIVINGVAVEEVTSYTVTENLTHIIASDSNPTTVNKNASFTLSYTAESGYIITSLTSNVGDVTFNVDHSSATVTGVATANIIVTGEATYQPKTFNVVVEKDAHIVADPSNPETITEGSSYTFRFTSESGWLISRCTSNYGTANIAEDKKSATVVYNNVSATLRIVLTSIEEIIPKVVITGTFVNATCNYTNGEVINREKNIIITATSGYEFKNTYHYEDNGYSYDLVKNLEKTTLTIDTTQITGLSDITLNDNYVATLPVETIGGFCNLYKVTEKELSQLSKVRFQKDTTSDTVVDYGSAITQLYILPLNIPAEIIGDKSNIILGSFDSQVESTLLNNYTVDYDMGAITVPAKYNNAYDFINTTCTLRVPFFNAVALDPENVVGHTINIKFTLDLYSGNVTMNVVSDFTGGIIYSATANIVTQIPFIQKQNNSVVNQLSNVFKYVIATPVIEVVRNIPYQADNSTFGRETVQVAKLNTVHGYCEVDNVNLVTLATNDEKDSIISLLKEGVFINE